MVVTQVVEVGGARPAGPKPLRKLRRVLASNSGCFQHGGKHPTALLGRPSKPCTENSGGAPASSSP